MSAVEELRAALDQALGFIDWLTTEPLLDGDGRLMEVDDIASHARIEAASIRRKLVKEEVQ